ncbi:MAG TPA: invasion associated locus B family protein [Xanthobacteraceae bacterium]|nr:invasion associated locus B family protein [Xanthobacteraceae bacterium]
MIYRIVSAPARSVGRSFVASVAVGAVAMLTASAALAQQPSKGKPAAKPPAAQAKPPAPQQQQQQPQQQAQNGPQLIYSPWTKFCSKGQEPNAKQVCFTGKDARTEAGMPVLAAALIEPEGEPKKILRITLPSPLQLQYGTRLIVDQGQPTTSPFFTCFANGCMADYEATADLIGKMKKGQMLTVQAINLAGNPISFPLPLAEFAKANEGPPTDPKVFEAQQKKLQEELQRRAEEARKKLESQQATPGKTQ